MSRYIDADALINDIENCSYDTWSKDINRTWWAQAVKVKDNIKECIKRQATADVVDVVRCGQCKHCTLTDEGEYNPNDIVCCYFMTDGMEENDYCSRGERREE